MKPCYRGLALLLAFLLFCGFGVAQSSPVVPRLVSFSGKAADTQGKAISGIAGVTFAIYKEQVGGAPLWLETQNVQADAKGNYTAQLGATKADGLPLDLFTSGEARWLGVRVNGAEEQPRVLLLSVPYALKAADAQTLGGLPPSAFVLATPLAVSASQGTGSDTAAPPSASVALPATSNVTTTGGTVNALPLFSTATNIQNSILTQAGTTTINVAGKLNLPATGAATAAAGKNSRPETMVASSFSSATSAAVSQTFQLQAEPAGNNTATPSGTLNFLYGLGATAPAETGLKINNKGLITFATGQTFPGSGTVQSVGLSAPSADFNVAGSPVTGIGTLALNWVVAPTSSNIANAIVKRDGAGNFSAQQITAVQVNASNPNSGGLGLSGSGSSGVYGSSAASNGNGVWGDNPNHTGVYGNGGDAGVWGHSANTYGLIGESYGTTVINGNTPDGVHGYASSHLGYGVYGVNADSTGIGVSGVAGSGSTNPYGIGVYGVAGTGVEGLGSASGVIGYGTASTSLGTGGVADSGGDAIYGEATGGGYAGYFVGDVTISGNLSKGGGSFKIDHPLDPANKYLYHSFVESPDMMNIYNGNVILDSQGEAAIELPEWFETLNRDFRYQLTPIGAPALLYVAEEINGNRFKIAGGRPGGKVSWQVTGVRQDAWANAHRIPVEEPKSQKERGFYLHPELFGAPKEKGIAWSRHPEAMKQIQEQRMKAPASPAAPRAASAAASR